jgi:hypothetical protein
MINAENGARQIMTLGLGQIKSHQLRKAKGWEIRCIVFRGVPELLEWR